MEETPDFLRPPLKCRASLHEVGERWIGDLHRVVMLLVDFTCLVRRSSFFPQDDSLLVVLGARREQEYCSS